MFKLIKRHFEPDKYHKVKLNNPILVPGQIVSPFSPPIFTDVVIFRERLEKSPRILIT